MKIETDLIPVNLLTIKACFRILTFGSVQDKCAGCGPLDWGFGNADLGFAADELRVAGCGARGRAHRAWCIEQGDLRPEYLPAAAKSRLGVTETGPLTSVFWCLVVELWAEGMVHRAGRFEAGISDL
jgi:hypothetical protein